MSLLTRLAWVLPCLVAACGSSTVRDDRSADGGDDRSTGGVPGDGGSAGFEETGGGPIRPSGVGGGFGAAGDFGAGGTFYGRAGDSSLGGTHVGVGGMVPEAGGVPGAGGGFIGDGGFFGAGGGFFGAGGSGAFGSGGRLVDPACCEAIPFCRAGYDQVSGPAECVRGDICYEATACCSTIWCKAHADQDAGACAAEAPPGVRYVSANASVCDRRAWTCPTNTYQYWDLCGCGCAQESSCPASVDCKAVPNDAICADDATCPYTKRVR